MPFPDWTTAVVADACVRLSIALRIAPPGLRSVVAGARVSGPVRPVQHYGSVDIFLEAFNSAAKGDVLVIDNGGILHEGCIGDLTVIEAANAGVVGLLVWGAHRDSSELTALAIPVFSYGAYPAGPAELRPRCNDALNTARFGHDRVTSDDFVFADTDGAIFVQTASVDPVLEQAARIWETSGARYGRSSRDARCVSNSSSTATCSVEPTIPPIRSGNISERRARRLKNDLHVRECAGTQVRKCAGARVRTCYEQNPPMPSTQWHGWLAPARLGSRRERTHARNS